MVTFQSETWYRREIVPEPLKWLAGELCKHYKRPRVAAGTKGDTNHRNGSHRSQEWILKSRFCTHRSYTVQSGLTGEATRYIAGLDFTPASLEQMLTISKRLDKAVRAGQLEAVTEWFGNVDGNQRVDGYDNINNRAATADSSHLWHIHISFRRSQANDMAVMRKVFGVLTGTTTTAPPVISTPAAEKEENMPLNEADKKWLTNLVWGPLPERADLGIKGETALGTHWHTYQRTGRADAFFSADVPRLAAVLRAGLPAAKVAELATALTDSAPKE